MHNSVVAKVTELNPQHTTVVATSNASLFRVVEQNTLGRDFVLGDIHGAFDMVLKGMKDVEFNHKVDRIFSVGDLIDRGPGSHRALEFLEKSYVFAARGNHDDEFSKLSLEDMRTLGSINWEGMKWISSVSDEKLLAIREKFASLPIAIQVQTSRGTVGILHGDVEHGLSWQQFVEALQRGDKAVIRTALWGRDRVMSKNDSGINGIDRVFVGHSVQFDGPKRLGNVYAIDTGMTFREIEGNRGALTMVNMNCKTAAIGKILDQNDTSHTVAEAGNGAFTAYARPSAR